jgi:thiaminase/transcriptional activator TenA
MSFTGELWKSTLPVYEEILRHPFIGELTDGSLARDRFLFYMKQDALYLRDFSRALALTGSRLPDADAAQAFMGFAHGVFTVERQLHESYFQEYGESLDAEAAPACFAYTQFLLAAATTDTHRVAAAALLPCFWVYREVGNEIVRRARAGISENPYARWIEMYSGEGYDESVSRAIDVVEGLGSEAPAPEQDAMQRAFERSVRLEWMFWDSAYRMEQWPPGP